MNFFWLDASACVKRYIVEEGTSRINHFFDCVSLQTSGDNLIIVSSDKRLLHAAQSEGMVTFNPETDTQTTLDILIDSP